MKTKPKIQISVNGTNPQTPPDTAHDQENPESVEGRSKVQINQVTPGHSEFQRLGPKTLLLRSSAVLSTGLSNSILKQFRP